MSWKEQLQPASFRGVTFAVDTIDTVFGRRNQLHEYPQRDEPYGEDLGKKAREYTINAFIIGDDYFADRDALIAAIEENESPGTLIHPTLGTKTVIPKDCRVIYSNQEGSLERFVLTFIEAGNNSFPDGLEDLQALVDLFSTDAISGILSNFESVFAVSNFPGFVLQAATTLGSSFVTTLLSAVGVGIPDADLFATFMESLNAFSDSMDSEVSTPATFGGHISSLITGLTQIYPDPHHAYIAQKRLTQFGDGVLSVMESTPSRIQEADNQEAIINLIKNSAAIEMVRITSLLDYASRQDAIAIRDEVDDILEERILALADAGNDEQYTVISDARAMMIKDINVRGAKFPDILTIKTDDEIPAQVLAYNQYEDAERDEEIIERNHIRNPLFIPLNTDIEVLV